MRQVRCALASLRVDNFVVGFGLVPVCLTLSPDVISAGAIIGLV